jgi:hypothetical protein
MLDSDSDGGGWGSRRGHPGVGDTARRAIVIAPVQLLGSRTPTSRRDPQEQQNPLDAGQVIDALGFAQDADGAVSILHVGQLAEDEQIEPGCRRQADAVGPDRSTAMLLDETAVSCAVPER